MNAYTLPCCGEIVCEKFFDDFRETCKICKEGPMKTFEILPAVQTREEVNAFLRDIQDQRESMEWWKREMGEEEQPPVGAALNNDAVYYTGRYWADKQVPGDLQCEVCHEVALNAVKTPCCRYDVCEHCARWKVTSMCELCGHAPITREMIKPSRVVRMAVNKYLKGIEEQRQEAENEARAGKEAGGGSVDEDDASESAEEEGSEIHEEVNEEDASEGDDSTDNECSDAASEDASDDGEGPNEAPENNDFVPAPIINNDAYRSLFWGLTDDEKGPERLRCKICNNIAFNAVKLSCCSANVCSFCESRAIRFGSECTICKGEPKSPRLTPSEAVRAGVNAWLKDVQEKRDGADAQATAGAVVDEKDEEGGKEICVSESLEEPSSTSDSTESEAAESESAKTTPPETTSAEVKPAEVKPAEVKPAESKPAEVKPAEDKPAEVKPAESKPVETKPAEGKPTESESGETKASESKPAETKSAEVKPTEIKPAEIKPAETKPAEFVVPDLPNFPLGKYVKSIFQGNMNTLVSVPWSIYTLCWALNKIKSFQIIQKWLTCFKKADIEKDINMEVEGAPAIFYAVARNCKDTILLLLNYGADPNALGFSFKIPVLAYSILTSWTKLENATEAVRGLVAMGATADAIPEDMYMNFLEQPCVKASSRVSTHASAAWCTEKARKAMVQALDSNLTIRYLLHLRKKNQLAPPRILQIAKKHNMTKLLTLPFYLIGQQYAVDEISTALYGRLAINRQKEYKQPLVFIFAGPSGHGKTELARNMGKLLSVPFRAEDCGKHQEVTDLFGPQMPYQGYQNGSPLNNFLAEHSGNRSVVFLDEFSRAGPDIYDTLLEVLDTGAYEDRRSRKPVNCSETIWIMATNMVDDEIMAFYDRHLKGKSEDERKTAPYEELEEEVRSEFQNQFNNLSGRLTYFIPFFPFTAPEAAVVAHKSILELGDTLHRPISLSNDNFAGRIHLETTKDGALCTRLAKNSYLRDSESRKLGARGIKDEVQMKVENQLIKKWSYTMPGEITDEMNEGKFVRFRVEVSEEGKKGIVRVLADGEIGAPRVFEEE